MPRTKKGQSTPRQVAYANRIFGGQGISRKQIALDVGYPPSVANLVKEKIESSVGFHAAMAKLAADSNNIALAAMHEFQVRGFKDFSNKDLVGALNAIGSAWSRFNHQQERVSSNSESKGNRLRTIVMNHIENQTLNTGAIHEAIPAPLVPPESKVVDVEEEKMDF